MRIQLVNWFVQSLKLEAKPAKQEESKEENKNNFSFSVGSGINPDNKRNFQIGFKIKVDNIRYTLSLEMAYNFRTTEDLTKEFMNSDFVKINAPAIAFPYLRTFISMITMQSGYQCVVLPSINFVALMKQNEK